MVLTEIPCVNGFFFLGINFVFTKVQQVNERLKKSHIYTQADNLSAVLDFIFNVFGFWLFASWGEKTTSRSGWVQRRKREREKLKGR